MAVAPAMIRKAKPGWVNPMQKPGAVSAHDLRANYNAMNGAGSAAGQSGHVLRAAYNQAKGAGAAGGNVATQSAPSAVTSVMPETAAPAAPAAPANVAAAPADNSNALFPGIRAFEPKNYEGSPLYKFQLDQGTKQLGKLYAARGFKGSGKEIDGTARFMNELGGQEAQRAQGVAEQEANRLERIQQNESNRLTGQGNDTWNRIMDVLNLMMGQNPMQYAAGMTDKLGSLVSGQGAIEGKNVVAQTPRVGGGGAATPPPRYNPPTPSGPNMGGVNGTGAMLNSKNNMDYTAILTNLLGRLF